MLNKLAEMIGFTYSVYFVKDNMFGGKHETTAQWNGLIGDLVKRVRHSFN